jgi:hypothetical protein
MFWGDFITFECARFPLDEYITSIFISARIDWDGFESILYTYLTF